MMFSKFKLFLWIWYLKDSYSFQLTPLINPAISAGQIVSLYTLGTASKNIENLNLNTNITRKIIHTSSAPLFMSTWGLYDHHHLPNVWAAMVPLTASIYLYSHQEKLTNILSRSGRTEEILKGPLVYTLILTLITLNFWMDKPDGIIALIQLSIGDGFSDIIGRKWGKTKWVHNNQKSVQGSLGFLGFSFPCTLGALFLFNQVYGCSYDYSLENILLISIGCSLVETVPKIDDNLSIPATSLGISYLIDNM